MVWTKPPLSVVVMTLLMPPMSSRPGIDQRGSNRKLSTVPCDEGPARQIVDLAHAAAKIDIAKDAARIVDGVVLPITCATPFASTTSVDWMATQRTARLPSRRMRC